MNVSANTTFDLQLLTLKQLLDLADKLGIDASNCDTKGQLIAIIKSEGEKETSLQTEDEEDKNEEEEDKEATTEDNPTTVITDEKKEENSKPDEKKEIKDDHKNNAKTEDKNSDDEMDVLPKKSQSFIVRNVLYKGNIVHSKRTFACISDVL